MKKRSNEGLSNLDNHPMLKNAIEKLNDFYYMDIEMNEITSATTENNRRKRLEDFANSEKIYLMFSIRILDECIDIPSCDAIFITYPSQSKVRTIQRLSRCIRTDKDNKYKIASATLKRDIECCLRSYVPRVAGDSPEEISDSVLGELALIQQIGRGKIGRAHV